MPTTIVKVLAGFYSGGREKSAPKKVDKYFKEVKKNNPDYSDSQAWATAWSIFCKHVNPDSESCKKNKGEYFSGKKAAVQNLRAPEKPELLELRKFVRSLAGSRTSVKLINGKTVDIKAPYPDTFSSDQVQGMAKWLDSHGWEIIYDPKGLDRLKSWKFEKPAIGNLMKKAT